MRSIFCIILFASLFQSCLTEGLFNEALHSYHQPRVDTIYGFGRDSLDNIIVNFRGSVTSKKSEPNHIKIPLKSYVETFSNAYTWKEIDSLAANSVELNRIYIWDQDSLDLTPPDLVLELSKETFLKGFNSGSLEPLKGNFYQTMVFDGSLYGYEEVDPITFRWELNEPLYIDNQQIERIRFIIEPRAKKKTELFLLLPVTLVLDVLTFPLQEIFNPDTE